MSASASVDCREMITFLADYLANEVPFARRRLFEAHLRICDSCVEYLKTYEETIRMTRVATQVEVEEMPEELVKAILDATLRR